MWKSSEARWKHKLDQTRCYRDHVTSLSPNRFGSWSHGSSTQVWLNHSVKGKRHPTWELIYKAFAKDQSLSKVACAIRNSRTNSSSRTWSISVAAWKTVKKRDGFDWIFTDWHQTISLGIIHIWLRPVSQELIWAVNRQRVQLGTLLDIASLLYSRLLYFHFHS